MVNTGRFNILPTKGNLGVGVAGPDALAPGQIGFFDAVTNVAITTKADADLNGFYAAIGVDKTGSGSTEDISRSYRTIYPKNFVAYSQKCYQAFQPKIITVADCVVEYETEYMIELKYINPDLYRVTENKSYKTYFLTYVTEKQIGSSTDPDIQKMYQSFLDQVAMNDEINDFIVLELLDPTALTVIPDLGVWVAANPGVSPTMRFTINKPVVTPTVMALYSYDSLREIDVNVYAIKGFESNSVITVTQEILFENTTGREIQEIERQAGGWNANPGLMREINAGVVNEQYLSDINEKYDLTTLHYKYHSTGGINDDYANDMYIMIAVPDGDDVTAAAVRDTLGTLLTGSTTGLAATACV